jgi:hypothetical protein
MRITGALCGFFIVPFWDADGDRCKLLDDEFRFTVSPCDGSVRVAVLALNLLKPLRDVKQAALHKLREWLLRGSHTSTIPTPVPLPAPEAGQLVRRTGPLH